MSRVEHLSGARIAEHRLPNGLRVIVAERPVNPVVALMTFYRVGSRNEREHEAGVSHFLEHMMFKGARRFRKGEVDRLTTELGGHNNAFTSNDHTAYWFELASDRWEHGLEIEADRMQGLALDPAELDAERAVVLEELSMSEDDPWRVLSQAIEAEVFPRHPYGRPIIGFPDTLALLSPERMRDYYQRFYHPGNATLVICGDVKGADALRAVRRHFARFEAGTPYATADCYRPPLAEPRGERRLALSWDDGARRLCMAWPTAPVCSDADYALDIVQTVLTAGRASRLQRSLVLDRALAVYVATANDARVEGGAFWLFAQCAPDVEPARLEQEIDREIARLASEPVSTAELRRAKDFIRSSRAFEHESASDLAEELGAYAVDADWRRALDSVERCMAVSAKDVRGFATKLLRPERRVLGWSLPRAGRNGK